MPKQNFYAVRKGKEVGVFLTWTECEERVAGHPGALFKKFSTAAEAEAFVRGEPSTTVTQGPRSTEDQSAGQKRANVEVAGEDQSIVVYSDGACKGNGRAGSVAGIGVYWGPGDPRNIAERCPGDQTNNRAELIAIIRVLETAPVNGQRLVIRTDSQYSINCFERWLRKWRDNGFRTVGGDPVKNVGIIRYLSALLDERGKEGQSVVLQYVRGHSSNPGNDGADAQANIGTTFQPWPDLDWEFLEARVKRTIGALIDTTVPPRKPAAPNEISNERPSKIPKSLNSTKLAGSNTPTPMADVDGSPSGSRAPGPAATSPALPPHSPFRPPAKNVNPKPTIYQRPVYQAVENVPNPPIIPAAPSLPIAIQPRTTPLESTPQTRSLHNRSSPSRIAHVRSTLTPEPPKLATPPESPLKVSKVLPPLVPVPVNDINFDDYKDCLLEGNDWENEIKDL